MDASFFAAVVMSTVCAVSTPYGTGGIAVVRLSGPEAVAVAERLTGAPLVHPVHFRRIPDLDDMVITTFRAPHSYTGEDVVEFSCHGSLYIQQELLRRLVDAGASLAAPGEFTRRAFLNGRLDLSQAEAVADLIAARTRGEQRLALRQLRGSVSGELEQLREELLRFTSLLELELDFADHEDLQFADRAELRTLLDGVQRHLDRLIASFRTGQALRDGISVAIVGPANAGKSTLLNALLHEERAIVSDIPGTTRDTVEDTLVLGGILFRLIDTAGLRPTDDPVEQLGIRRSRQAMQKADIVVRVLDATASLSSAGEDFGGMNPDDAVFLTVFNKADLLSSVPAGDDCYISAAGGEIAPLEKALVREAGRLLSAADTGSTVISSVRHYEALRRARKAVDAVRSGLDGGLGTELVALDLHDALDALATVTGRITSDEVLAGIFSRFCVGK